MRTPCFLRRPGVPLGSEVAIFDADKSLDCKGTKSLVYPLLYTSVPLAVVLDLMRNFGKLLRRAAGLVGLCLGRGDLLLVSVLTKVVSCPAGSRVPPL